MDNFGQSQGEQVSCKSQCIGAHVITSEKYSLYKYKLAHSHICHIRNHRRPPLYFMIKGFCKQKFQGITLYMPGTYIFSGLM